MHVLALTPFYYGHTGGPTNERLLLNTLSTKVDNLKIISLVPLKDFIKASRYRQKSTVACVILIPSIKLLSPIIQLIISFVIIPVIFLFDFFKKPFKFIYVREVWFGFGLSLVNRTRKILMIKVPSALEENPYFKDRLFYRLFRKFELCLYRFSLLRSRYVSTYSTIMHGELEKLLHIKRNDWMFLPPGIDSKLLKKIKRRNTLFKKSFFRIGFIGWLTYWQGLDILVDAMKIVKEVIPNYELFIVGDGPLRSYLENECKKTGIRYTVTGFINHEKALRYLSTFDLLVVPRRRTPTIEGVIPLKVIEAWGLGVPVIVSPLKIYRLHGCTHGNEVFYSEPDSQSVANAILTILSDSHLRENLKTNGYEASKKFNYAIIVEKLLKEVKGNEDLA